MIFLKISYVGCGFSRLKQLKRVNYIYLHLIHYYYRMQGISLNVAYKSTWTQGWIDQILEVKGHSDSFDLPEDLLSIQTNLTLTANGWIGETGLWIWLIQRKKVNCCYCFFLGFFLGSNNNNLIVITCGQPKHVMHLYGMFNANQFSYILTK